MIKKEYYEKYKGQDVYNFTIKDDIEVKISTLGGTVLSILVPDKKGKTVDVALGVIGTDNMVNSGYMGVVVGRCGNRIKDGIFSLNGKNYQLNKNEDGISHLHGGIEGFDKKIFDYKAENNTLTLKYFSPDMEEGYPSNLNFTVKYTVKKSDLIIEYFGESDGTTLFNPTNHTYFNLNGESDGSILDNVMKINADYYLPITKNYIPTGEIRSVLNTPFDFNVPKKIGRDINCDDEQLAIEGGYDHNFCIKDSHFATVYSEKTGIQMDCYTDLHGVQFYSGNLIVLVKGKSDYKKYAGFCLESQFYPNAINHENFKSPILNKDDKFYSKTEYRFSIKK
ncbi:MAG: galactose mutarotase [Clostridia bacterium]|nr:galactose mutarotase [Clostridia bacterium]